MGNHMKAYEILSSIVKPRWELDENWPRYQMIASEMFNVLELLLQVMASNLNVQS